MERNLKRSARALLAGVLFTIILTTLVDIVLHAVHFFPGWEAPLNDVQCAIATLYRVVIGVGGAWLTARLAPAGPMKHALWLGVLGTVIGAIGAAATWNRGLGPHWYGIALAALAIPQSWVGGRIHLSAFGGK